MCEHFPYKAATWSHQDLPKLLWGGTFNVAAIARVMQYFYVTVWLIITLNMYVPPFTVYTVVSGAEGQTWPIVQKYSIKHSKLLLI